jgi:PAS domain S-box-containing protein
MTGRDEEPNEGTEHFARQHEDRLPKAHEAMSPERLKLMLHNLRKHQVELERQNEHLRSTNVELNRVVKQRKSDLLENEELTRAMVNAPNEAMALLDREGMVLDMNQTSVRRFHKTREQIIGTSVWDLFPADVVPKRKKNLALMFETGQSVRAEDLREGTWTNYVIYPVRDAAGKVTRAGIFSQDITVRKAAEARERAALQRLEAFETAVNQGPAVILRRRIVSGIWPIEMISANVRRFGYDAEEFISGRTIWGDLIHVDDRERVKNQTRTFLQQGREEFSRHYRLMTKSGDTRWLEEHCLVITSPEGQPNHIQGVVTDVTSLKKQKQLQRESEERYRQLFQAEFDAVVVFDAQTRQFVDVNEAALELYGYTREEFLNLKHRAITAEPEIADKSIRQTLNGRRRSIPLQWHRKKDGTVFPVEIAPSTFILDGKTVLCGIVRDITGRRNAEQLRLAQQRRLRQLAHKLASAQDDEQRRIAEGLHDDVAQLLVACTMRLAVATREAPVEVRDHLTEVAGWLREAGAKVRSLSFELSSSTLYKLGLQHALEELGKCISERHGVCIEVRSEDELVTLDQTSAVVLFKAARELLFNVVKHAGVKNAAVSLAQVGGYLRLTVEDQGQGFLDGSLTDESGTGLGLGLGLFGIQERLRDLGGKMRIESTPGIGSRVTLWAPILEETTGTEPSPT